MKSAEKNLLSFVKIVDKYLPRKIETIVEVGARDCFETLIFNRLFPLAQIYTFECNPETLPYCRERVKHIKNIKLIEAAVTDEDGPVSFYPIDTDKTTTSIWPNGNPGASSLLKASGNYPLEKYIQKEITVQAITLVKFMEENNISKIDLMWMDIQGAELKALVGMGNKIKCLSAIHVEVEFSNIYKNQPQFKDIKKYLNQNGFLFIDFTNRNIYSGDAIFIRKARIPKNIYYIYGIYSDKTIKSIILIKNILRQIRLKFK